MAAMLSSMHLRFLIALFFWQEAYCKPSQGVWDFDITKDNVTKFLTKSAFSNTQLKVTISCEKFEKDFPLKINWLVGRLKCANIEISEQLAFQWIASQEPIEKRQPIPFLIDPIFVSAKYTFINGQIILLNSSYAVPMNSPDKKLESSKIVSPNITANGTIRKKRENPDKATHKPIESKQEEDHVLLKTEKDGYFVFIVHFISPLPANLKLQMNVKFSSGDSFIAAVDWPLLYFYGIMGLVYIFYGILWLIMLACNWRDLLRVQFWIGGVILLGMLEKAVFFAEYENINKTGQSVKGAIIVAELVSCLKRTLARMLVIIVSLGYGIVKPRLGQTFHKILLVGGIFFILASIEGCMRALAGKEDQSKQMLLPGVPLAVTDALIFFWIFTSLLQTTRTLRLRRNIVKLSLYRHFTNTLIFAVIAYMIWSLTQHKFKECLSDWKELWMDDAFWHLLFSIILFVIMILWRPTANNQRYAFSPLLDAAEDEMEDDQVLSEAFDGMKMRSKSQKNGGPSAKETGKTEDDLKWVEENIPTSFSDKLLPALDSDEEIMNTKFEANKME